MKLSLRRSELIEIIAVLKRFIEKPTEVYTKQFNVFLRSNYDRLINEGKITLDNRPIDSERFICYKQEVEKVQLEMAKKDENGNPIIRPEDGAFAIAIEKLEAYKIKIKELAEKYKDEIDKRNKEDEEYVKVLEEVIEVDVVKISFNNIPDSYSHDSNNTLMILVKESPEEIEAML